MSDLAVGFGLVLVIEGLLWGLSPQTALKVLETAAAMPEQLLRRLGWLSVAAGMVVVWLIRG